MSTLRLTGLLRKRPATAGFFYGPVTGELVAIEPVTHIHGGISTESLGVGLRAPPSVRLVQEARRERVPVPADLGEFVLGWLLDLAQLAIVAACRSRPQRPLRSRPSHLEIEMILM